MFTKKLQILVYSCVSLDQKLTWLKQWNESNVLKEVKKFPKQDFLDIQIDILAPSLVNISTKLCCLDCAFKCIMCFVNFGNCVLQFKVEALVLYASTVLDLGLTIRVLLKVLSFLSYIQ
jgi:hypothetical protein